MTTPVVHAFFVGRALAETIAEEFEHGLTDILSELGKADAEQRDRLRQFTEKVMAKASQAEATAAQSRPGSAGSGLSQNDLQALLDDLRAEVARLRSELQRYRNRTP